MLEEFLAAYLECAAWADAPEGCGISEFSEEAKKAAREECEDFLAYEGVEAMIGGNYSQAGHDFWLTRNGHGAGFWDRDEALYGPGNGQKLTAISKTYGTSNVEVDGDKLIFI